MITQPHGDTSSASVPVSASVTIDELVERARALVVAGERRILGIVGAPGAGKSTLSAALLEGLGAHAVLVGMDGFHLANDELVRLNRRDRKGAPDTFDVDGYVALLGRLRSQTSGVIYAPSFDRSIEESIASAVAVPADAELVITEGNYLLCTDNGWQGVSAQLHETWYLDVSAEEREARLIDRRRSHGEDLETAAAWVHGVDAVNAQVVEASKSNADLIITLTDSPAVAPAPNHHPSSAHEGVTL